MLETSSPLKKWQWDISHASDPALNFCGKDGKFRVKTLCFLCKQWSSTAWVTGFSILCNEDVRLPHRQGFLRTSLSPCGNYAQAQPDVFLYLCRFYGHTTMHQNSCTLTLTCMLYIQVSWLRPHWMYRSAVTCTRALNLILQESITGV